MGFYDAKGYWRSDGDGFYDARGNWVNPGGAFYDGKGYLRNQGEGFYDAQGNWVSPGGAFYDGKGYLQSSGVAVGATVSGGSEIVIGVGFLLFIPVMLLWVMTMFLVEWMAAHLYLVFAGYAIADIILCCGITKLKRHCGMKAALSFMGNYMCILSFIYITLVYAVPYVMINGDGFGSFFEFTAALAIGAAGIVILQFFNYYHEKAIWEWILGVLFFVITIALIKYEVGDSYTIESLAETYHVKVSKLFIALFGFVV